MALVGMLGHGDIYNKKADMASPNEDANGSKMEIAKQMQEKGADGAESTANTTAPPTPLSVPTSSPALMPLSRTVSDQSSCEGLVDEGASDRLKFPAGHGSGDTYRFRDRHGALRYTAGYATDAASQEKSCHGMAGAGRGACLDGARRVPCRRYGRDGRMACRY